MFGVLEDGIGEGEVLACKVLEAVVDGVVEFFNVQFVELEAFENGVGSGEGDEGEGEVEGWELEIC